jgi:VWFA-related protein
MSVPCRRPLNSVAQLVLRGRALASLLLLVLSASLLRGQQQRQPQAEQQQSTQGSSPRQPQSQQTAASSKSAQAQPPTAPTKITAETNMVTVPVSVRDKKGRILSDLSKADFTLSEDGKPQDITYFAREDQLPLTVGLLVDTSLSQRAVLSDERSASATFIDQTLRTDMKDQAFLIHFDYEVELLQDLTTFRQKLDSALNLLQIASRDQDTSGSQHPGQQDHGNRGSGRGGGTHLYDAVFLASDELMKKQPGRKALIVLSDGVDRGSKESLASAIEAAQRANTVVYSILFKGEEPTENFGRRHGGWRMGGPGYGGPGYGGPGYGGQRRYPGGERPDGKKILDRISKETGGRLFEVSKKQPVDKIYTQITEELRDQYVLGYVPPKSETAGYHKIAVATKDKDQIVQARDGYYWNPPAATPGQ